MISIKQIKYALAIEEHSHFKKAADACAISQSALSSAINDMEKLLGFQVFERDNKKVLVTPLGRQMLDKARQVYVQINDIDSLACVANEPLSGPLSLGMIPTIAPYLLPLMLPELQSGYPRLKLTIEEDQSQYLVSRVLSGHLDTAILALPFDCQGLLTFPFWEEDFYWVTHSEDDLAKLNTVNASEIELSKLMLLKEGHCLKDHALSVCGLNNNSQSNEASMNIRGTSLSTMIQLVSGQLGTTLIPEMALSQLVDNHPELAAIRLNEPGPHRQLAFIVRPNYPGLANIELLKSMILQQLEATAR